MNVFTIVSLSNKASDEGNKNQIKNLFLSQYFFLAKLQNFQQYVVIG